MKKFIIAIVCGIALVMIGAALLGVPAMQNGFNLSFLSASLIAIGIMQIVVCGVLAIACRCGYFNFRD